MISSISRRILQRGGISLSKNSKFNIGTNLRSLSSQVSTTKSDKPTSDGKERKHDVYDVLSNHGGKIALVAFGLAAALIYSYVKSAQERSNVEKAIEDNIVLDPYEIQLLRNKYHLTLEQYNKIVNVFKSNLDGRSSDTISYEDFIKRVAQEVPDLPILDSSQGGFSYLLDKMVQYYIMRNIPSQDITTFAETSLPYYKLPVLPVDLLLVMMNLTMTPNRSKDRIQGLLQLIDAKSTDFDSKSEEERTIRRDVLVRLIDTLVITDQVPPERQIEETGVKWPIKLYRRKSAESMVSTYEKEVLKIEKEKQAWTVGEVERILSGRAVCVWGLCYRSD